MDGQGYNFGFTRHNVRVVNFQSYTTVEDVTEDTGSVESLGSGLTPGTSVLLLPVHVQLPGLGPRPVVGETRLPFTW